jgi:hypothetical protein
LRSSSNGCANGRLGYAELFSQVYLADTQFRGCPVADNIAGFNFMPAFPTTDCLVRLDIHYLCHSAYNFIEIKALCAKALFWFVF